MRGPIIFSLQTVSSSRESCTRRYCQNVKGHARPRHATPHTNLFVKQETITVDTYDFTSCRPPCRHELKVLDTGFYTNEFGTEWWEIPGGVGSFGLGSFP